MIDTCLTANPAIASLGDIKSQNILFSSDGTAKIADFGGLLQDGLPSRLDVWISSRNWFWSLGHWLRLGMHGQPPSRARGGHSVGVSVDHISHDSQHWLKYTEKMMGSGQMNLRQVAGTLGYSDPLYTRRLPLVTVSSDALPGRKSPTWT